MKVPSHIYRATDVHQMDVQELAAQPGCSRARVPKELHQMYTPRATPSTLSWQRSSCSPTRVPAPALVKHPKVLLVL